MENYNGSRLRFVPLILNMVKIISLFLSIIFISEVSTAQKVSYQKGYFRYPLDIPAKLNANFGEMRPNHFHMGLDLFTLRKENLPVYAAADGYISKIKIETGGFGNAIYIAHPNGTTTLYAHMNGFYPELTKYIKDQQYKLESWALDIEIPKGRLPVKKGDYIGPSGNTGASQGPHVHFEIRETDSDKCLNPLLFGFNIPDAVPPQIHKLAFYDRYKSIYEQTPILVSVIRTGEGRYKATVPILSTDLIQVAIQATDQTSNAPNQNGIYKTILKVNGKATAGFTIDRISYGETRYLNAHIDYRYKAGGGSYLQLLSPLPGDQLDIYPYPGRGMAINIPQGTQLPCVVEVFDSDGNKSIVEFTLQSVGRSSKAMSSNGIIMKADEVNVYENEDIEVYLPEGMIYDSINFRYNKIEALADNSFSDIHQIHDSKIPVHGGMKIRIKSERVIPYPLRSKMLIQLKTGTRTIIKKANWSMDKFGAEFRDFGSFQLIADDKAPVITGLSNGAKVAGKITIFVTDDHGVVKHFRGEIDSHWVLFEQKGGSYSYKIDERCPPGEHIVKIAVEDEAGNTSVREFNIIR